MQDPNEGKYDPRHPPLPAFLDDEDVPNPPGLIYRELYDLPPIYTPVQPPPAYSTEYTPPPITQPPPYVCPPEIPDSPPPPYFPPYQGNSASDTQLEEAAECTRDICNVLCLVDKQFIALPSELEDMVPIALYAFVMREDDIQRIRVKEDIDAVGVKAMFEYNVDIFQGRSHLIVCSEFDVFNVRCLPDPGVGDPTSVVRVIPYNTFDRFPPISILPILLRIHRNMQLIVTDYNKEYAVCLLPESASISDIVDNVYNRERIRVYRSHMTVSLRPSIVYNLYVIRSGIAYIEFREDVC